jgi:DNA modification methylase
LSVELIEGECLEMMKDIPDASVDLVVTSPPYDSLRLYKGYTFNFEGIAAQLYRIVKDGGVVVWIVADATVKGNETGTSFRQALHFRDVCGFLLTDTMIYHKTDSAFPRFGHRKYPNAFEYMFILSKGRPKTFNIIRDRANKTAGRVMSGTVRQQDGTLKVSRACGKQVAEVGARSNVWNYSTGFRKSAAEDIAYQHPAIFPESLAADHITTWSNPGDKVLDPMMGSGTTGKMAVLHNRSFIGIEVSTEYFSIAAERITSAMNDTSNRD